MPATLTRRVSFAAAHRYRLPQWSEARNEEVFGLCARPNFHGHGYVCEVTVCGEIDPETGMIVDLALLDRILAREVRERFDHRNINLDVPEFAEGKLVPTGENLARFIFRHVRDALALTPGNTARVSLVSIAEDDTLRTSWRED